VCLKCPLRSDDNLNTASSPSLRINGARNPELWRIDSFKAPGRSMSEMAILR
jgi:hypothetical protein